MPRGLFGRSGLRQWKSSKRLRPLDSDGKMRLARHRHTVMYFLAYLASSSKAMSRLAADQTASSLLRS